jgi:hypothetical protein
LKRADDLDNIKVGTFVRGVYDGSQHGAMQFICAYRSGSDIWFLGTDFTIGTRAYDKILNYKSINNDSLVWSEACDCSWTVWLYLKSGVVTVLNCKIPTYNEASMINQYIRANGFPYWTSTKYDDSKAYSVHELGTISAPPTSITYRGVVPLAKVSL